MTYERNFNLLNSKFRELFFPTLITSIAGNFAVLVDAFFISMFMGSVYLSVVQSIEPFVAFINVVYWLIGLGGSIVCTMARAEFDEERSNSYFTIAIIGIIIIGLLITLSTIVFQNEYVNLKASPVHGKNLLHDDYADTRCCYKHNIRYCFYEIHELWDFRCCNGNHRGPYSLCNLHYTLLLQGG